MVELRGASEDLFESSSRRLGLTQRQYDVLKLAANGMSRKEIARHLGISVRTVEDHFGRMRERTGAHNDAELVATWIAASVPEVSTDSQVGAGDDIQPQVECPEPVRRRGQPALQPKSSMAGILIGYVRCPSVGESMERKVQILKEAGCVEVFEIGKSGMSAVRTGLSECLDCLSPGDTLVVPSLDQMGDSLQGVITAVAGLRCRGLEFRSLRESLDTAPPEGRLIFHVFAVLADFASSLTVDPRRQLPGINRRLESRSFSY